MKKTLLLVLTLSITHLVLAKDIHVSKSGNNSNTGTLASPYLTISKAAIEANAGDIVYIHEGTYEETLTPARSGTAGNPIVFTSYQNEKVIISAMQALSGWAPDTGSVYKITIPWDDLGEENFVINGDQALDLARWPNNIDGDPYTMDSRRSTGGTGKDVLTNARMDFAGGIPYGVNAWKNGGSLHYYGDRAGKGWTCWRAYIDSNTPTSVNFTMSLTGNFWIYNEHRTEWGGEFFLQGIREALDYQNEWYFDSASKTLFVQLPNGVAPTNGKVSMRRRKLTANLNGKSNIELRNIALFGGSVDINGNNNKLEGVVNLWGNTTLGISKTLRSGSQSVNVRGNNNIIDRCNIGFGSGTGIFDQANNTQILNSYIHNFCLLGNYDAPIHSRGSNGGTYKNNTITRGGRDGIQAIGGNLEVAYNDVSYSNLMADDCALFYYSGPDGAKTIPTADVGTNIHHNWFHDAYSHGSKFKAAGIYLDTNPKGFLVHHNVVWNTAWTAVQINWNARNIDIFNNSFAKNRAIMGAWHYTDLSKGIDTNFGDVRVWNNLGDQQSSDLGGNQESEATWEPRSDQQNNLVSKPSFVDWANNDYNIQTGSVAVNAGRTIAPVTFRSFINVDVTEGFIGPLPDVGAYELGGEKWVPGITWNLQDGPASIIYNLPGEGYTKPVVTPPTIPTVVSAKFVNPLTTLENTADSFTVNVDYSTISNGQVVLVELRDLGQNFLSGSSVKPSTPEAKANVPFTITIPVAKRPLPNGSYSLLTFVRTANPSTPGGFDYSPNQTVQIEVLDSTSLDVKDFNFKNVTIYPNPTAEQLNIQGINQATDLIIYDLAGNKVVSKTVTGGDPTVNVTGLAEGVYILTNTNRTAFFKFIKQN